MTIRLMRLEDHEQLAKLWEPEHMESGLEYLQAVLDRNPTTCFVKEIDGRIVGAACGLFDGRRGFIQSVAVLPEERGKGYGKAVVQAVIDALLELGTKRIRLFVLMDNAQVLPFYEQLGFVVHKHVLYMGLRGEGLVG
jgi:ribosomal protein S18 acetylase RimI-like enzyme